jgi:hypothetical protein
VNISDFVGRAAVYVDKSLRGAKPADLDPAALAASLDAEWKSLWVLLAVAAANVVLGKWRPRLRLLVSFHRNQARHGACESSVNR